MRLLAMVLLVLSAAVLSFSQNFLANQTPFTKDALMGNGSTALGLESKGNNSLLDPSRFSMHQSYSMNYMSNGQNSDMTGLYLNRLQYDFQVPVTLQVDVGFFHKPMSMAGNMGPAPGEKNALLTIPRVGLLYQPSKNFSMAFEYFNIPAGYGNSMMPYGFMQNDPFAPGGTRSAAAGK